MLTAAKAWSPNLAAPDSVDLPMVNDGSGQLVPEVVQKWESFSPHMVIQVKLWQLFITDDPP